MSSETDPFLFMDTIEPDGYVLSKPPLGEIISEFYSGEGSKDPQELFDRFMGNIEINTLGRRIKITGDMQFCFFPGSVLVPKLKGDDFAIQPPQEDGQKYPYSVIGEPKSFHVFQGNGFYALTMSFKGPIVIHHTYIDDHGEDISDVTELPEFTGIVLGQPSDPNGMDLVASVVPDEE